MIASDACTQGILKGKFHCTVDLLFDWFGLVCFAKKIVSSHTADSKPVKQEVNGDTSPFSVPCCTINIINE
jgi:hypothetical protein